jgi:hypothetical protein
MFTTSGTYSWSFVTQMLRQTQYTKISRYRGPTGKSMNAYFIFKHMQHWAE